MSPLHSSNKPRSLHRQSSTPNPTNINNRHTLVPLSSNLEQYVDQWLTRNSNSNSSSRRHSVSSEKSGDNSLNGNPNGSMTSAVPTSPPVGLSPKLQSQSTTSSLPVSTPVSTEQGRRIPWSAPHSTCPCCQLPDCDSWRKTTRTIQKLEMELQMAAEIGQSLLQKNESYMMESNELNNRLKQYHDRNEELILSLDDSERLAQRLNREKDKWMWQYEKSEQILNESVADLETTNEKCAALTRDLEETKLEMEKLQLFKYKSHQSDTREDTLQSKLEDTKQELMISRKNELGLETKYKKLMARYEALSCSYQDMCKKTSARSSNINLIKPLSSMSAPTAADIQQASTDELVTFIKELISTNNGLKSELLDTTTRLDDMRTDMNTLQDKQRLDQSQPEPMAKGQSIDDGNMVDQSDETRRRAKEQKSSDDIKSATFKSRRLRSASARIPRTKSTRESAKPPTPRHSVPIPQATKSTPVVHHHYHYYLRQQQNEGTGEPITKGHDDHDNMMSRLCSDQNCTNPFSTSAPEMPMPPHLSPPKGTMKNDQDGSVARALNATDSIQHQHHHKTYPGADNNENVTFTLSPSNSLTTTETKPNQTNLENSSVADKEPTLELSTNTTFDNHHTPYTTLYEQAAAILQRIRSTDARTLNRRLQRTFDIVELTNMSNAILQNVVTDVETMDARFLWLTPDENDEDDTTESTVERPSPCPTASSFLVNEFFPLLRLLQDLLQEIGQQSITINHLQVAYVKKVEENEARVEQEILEKRLGTTSTISDTPITPSLLPSASTSTPFSSISFSSADSLIPTTESPLNCTNNITSSPVSWLSALLKSSSSSSIDAPSDMATRPVTEDTLNSSRGLDSQQGGLYAHSRVKRPARRRTINSRIGAHSHQQHAPTTSRLWPSLASVMDEWSHLTQVKQVSSSLDREWLWTCSDDALTSTSRWLKD